MLQTLKENPLILPLRKALYEQKFASHTNVNYFRGAFHSFEEAMASAPETKPTGYDNPAAASMYKERTEKIYSTDYPVLFWMEKIKNEVTRVFDFGGHIGVHYYSYPRLLDFNKIDQWMVCDVEAVCEEGSKYALENDRLKKLSFVTDISACESYDLFMALGSLQYLEWELHEKLNLLKNRPQYLIINSTPLHPTLKTITLNNIGTSFCPYHIRIENKFFDGLKSLGYTVLDSWKNEEKSCHVAFNNERSINYYTGAVLKLSR